MFVFMCIFTIILGFFVVLLGAGGFLALGLSFLAFVDMFSSWRRGYEIVPYKKYMLEAIRSIDFGDAVLLAFITFFFSFVCLLVGMGVVALML